MSTKILKSTNTLFLLPQWTLEHVGVNNQSGHMDIKNSSGSVFNQGVDVEGLFEEILSSSNTKVYEHVMQMKREHPVGFSALCDNTDNLISPTGVILKEEAPQGSRVASTVLALAFTDERFGENDSQTNIVSAIAPLTQDAQFLPDDVKENDEVLKAMKEGRLKTFVSIFPGPILINGKPLPRTSQMTSDTLFRVHPDNSSFISSNQMNLNDLMEFVREFNHESLKNNLPSKQTREEDIKRIENHFENNIDMEVQVMHTNGKSIMNKKQKPLDASSQCVKKI